MSRLVRHAFMCLVIATIAAKTFAGEIQLAWDPTAGASGYKVYYGTSSGNYGSPVVVYGTSTTIQGLQDCVSYYVAVKAFNAAGESPNYSNELTGWSRPSITSATPSTAVQGDQIVVDIMGANFQNGAAVDLGNPQVLLTSVTAVTCNHIQLLATVAPTGQGMRAARVGRLNLTVENPDSVFGMRPEAFEVLINPARFDINKSDETTTNRIDGKDTVYLSRQFGMDESNPNYDPDNDFDGDGWVDGQDLAFVASNLGRCWSFTTKSWRLDACPNLLQ